MSETEYRYCVLLADLGVYSNSLDENVAELFAEVSPDTKYIHLRNPQEEEFLQVLSLNSVNCLLVFFGKYADAYVENIAMMLRIVEAHQQSLGVTLTQNDDTNDHPGIDSSLFGPDIIIKIFSVDEKILNHFPREYVDFLTKVSEVVGALK